MMSFKSISILIIIVSIGVSSFGQSRESNTWYFGTNAGLNFNVTPPQALTDGALITGEGCATISNKRGDLLFYTNGVIVYNRNHVAMPNGTGLLGNSSSTQSSIIIPNPGDTNLYYIFTTDCLENDYVNGYNYSVVDMRLNGGLGDVTVQKNINLYSPSTERLTAVKAANGIDYWVITKGLNNNRFTAYKVDCNGINLTPVISDVGTVHIFNPSFFSGAGQLKVSPDGKKVCVAFTGPPNAIAEIFDFDNNTGILSNPITLTGYQAGFVFIYGIEFSPNSRLLYVSRGFQSKIDQYDISSGNQATIMASKIVLNTPALVTAGLQLAPDKKIYIAATSQPALSVINNPDVYGVGCNLSLNTVDLAGMLSSSGLPAYISSFFDVSNHIDFNSSFIDCHVQFNGTTDLVGSLTWNWDFGDGTLGNGQVVDHSYRQVGTYNVTLKVRSSSAVCSLNIADSFSITKSITINNVFAVDYDHNAACVNQPVQFNDNTVLTVGNITNRTWDFDDGSPLSNVLNPVHTFNTPGLYNVKLLISTSGICNADSMIKQIYIDTKPTTVFTPVNGCINQPVQFTDNSTNTAGGINKWKWFFGDGDSSVLKNPVHTYLNYGNFNVQLQVTSAHGCADAAVSKPIVIESKPIVAFDILYPCLDKTTVFNSRATNTFGNIISHNWNFDDGNSSVLINTNHQYLVAGNYNISLAVSTANGCSSTLIKPTELVMPFAYAGPDTIVIIGQPYQLHAVGSGSGTYSWTPAAALNNASIANPIVTLQHDERFYLTTTSAAGCVATDDVFIKVVTDFDVYVPSAFTPNGNGNNELLIPYPVGMKQLNYFKIFNRYGQQIYSTTQFGNGWDGKINGKPQPTGTYVWVLQAVNMLGRLVNKSGSSLLLK